MFYASVFHPNSSLDIQVYCWWIVLVLGKFVRLSGLRFANFDIRVHLTTIKKSFFLTILLFFFNTYRLFDIHVGGSQSMGMGWFAFIIMARETNMWLAFSHRSLAKLNSPGPWVLHVIILLEIDLVFHMWVVSSAYLIAIAFKNVGRGVW